MSFLVSRTSYKQRLGRFTFRLMSRSRAWCVTSYDENAPDFKTLIPKLKYFIIGDEVCPTTGRHHWQCYFYSANPIRFETLKAKLPGAHLAPAKGTPQQNKDYCSKESVHDEYGELPAQGKRTDIGEFLAVALSGKRLDASVISDFPEQFAKYHRAYDRALLAVHEEKKEHSAIEVLVLIGPSGSGKTKRAYEIDPDLFQVTDFNWWDGYAGQRTVLFDDFYGDCKYGMLLRLLDRYQFRLPIKGGFTWKRWSTVIITSNDHPDGWYKTGLTAALKRRLTNVITIDNSEPISEDVIPTQPVVDLTEE